MSLLQRIDAILNTIEHALLVLLLALMVVLAFAQVALRNVFSTGIFWADVLLRHLVLWLGFLGALLAASDERHIHIDALRHLMPERLRRVADVVTHLFAAFVCFLFMQASWSFVQNEIAVKRMATDEIPPWVAEIIIPIGFGLLVVHFIIRSVLRAGDATRKEPAE